MYLFNFQLNSVLAVVDTVGRLDQVLSNLHTLFLTEDILTDMTVYLLSGNSLTWLMKPGTHTIDIPLNLRKHEEWCALLPVGTSCQVTTTGLKWNLSKYI